MNARHDVPVEQLLGLWQAALVVQQRLFPDPSDRHPRLLGTIAIALCELIPVYARSPDEGRLRQLTDAEIVGGRFNRNALVCAADLERASAMLRCDLPGAARASLTLRQSPRRG